jgi:hypothetical protein
VGKLVHDFVALRDRKRQLEAQHKSALDPYNQVMDQIVGKLLEHMQKTGVTTIGTEHGTCYETTKQSATISDGDAFRDFVVTDREFDLVDWRANAKRIFEYIKKTGRTPPGVNPSTFVTLGVRRPTEKAED